METLDENSKGISDKAANAFGAAAVWVIIFGVLLFIGTIVLLISTTQIFQVSSMAGLIYLVIAVAYGYLGYSCMKQGLSAIKLKASRSQLDLEAFAVSYRNYWMFLIIFIIISIILLFITAQMMASEMNSLRELRDLRRY